MKTRFSRRQMLVLLLSLAFWTSALAEGGKDDDKNKQNGGDNKSGKTGDNKSGDNKSGDKKPEDKKPEDKKPEDKKPETKKPEDKKPDDKKPEDKSPGSNSGNNGSNSGSNSGSGKDANKPPADDSSRSRTIYDSVSVARNGTVVLSSGKLETSSPWANYLAPGMWVRAQGTWNQDLFRATSLEIADPAYFSYYRGPSAAIGFGSGWVEAWYTANTPNAVTQRLMVQSANATNEVLLLARSEGGKLVAVPPGLPAVSNAPQGWVLARGEVQGDNIRWKSVEPFNR